MNEKLYDKCEIPAVMDVSGLGSFLGIGRNNAYQLVRSERIKSIRIGKKIRIPRHAVLQFLGADSQQ